MTKFLIDLCNDNPNFLELVEGEILSVKSSTAIINKDELVSHIYIILEGQVRVAAENLDENINPAFSILGENEVFGELSLFSNEPASAQVTTLKDSKLIRLNKKKVELFFEENVDQGYIFIKELVILVSTRLRHTNNKVLDIFSWGLDKDNISN